MPVIEKVVQNSWSSPSSTEQSWVNLSRIHAADSNWSGCEDIASKSGTRSKPAAIGANSCGFNIHQNSRIDRVTANIRTYVRNPTGGYTGLLNIPYVDFKLYYVNGGGESSVKRYNASVPSNPAYLQQAWVLSEIPNCKPVHINSASFGVMINPGRNTSYNVGDMHIDYASLIVEYTDPTYSLSASITPTQILGGNVIYTITLNNTNGVHQGYSIPVTVAIPSGLTVVSQSGNGTYTGGVWNAILSGNTATLTLVLSSSSVGNKTITSTVNYTGTSISKTTNIQNPTYSLQSLLTDTIIEGWDFSYTLNLTTDSDLITTKNVTIPIPVGVSYVRQNGNGTYNPSTGVWAATFINRSATIEITFTATSTGVKTFTATVDGGSPDDTREVLVLQTDVTSLFAKDYIVPDTVLDYMTDGEEYTYSWYCLVEDTVLTEIYNGEKNFKVGLWQDNLETLSDRPLLLDTLTRCSVSFIHDSSKILKLRLYGQYIEISPDTCKVTFAGFKLAHGDEVIWTETGVLLSDPENLLANGDYSTATLPAVTASLPIRLNNINFSGLDTDSTLIVKGIAVSFDYICTGGLSVLCALDIDGEKYYQSIVLDEGEGTCILGGSGEYWNIPEYNIFHDDLSFILEFLNTSSTTNNIQIKNVQLQLITGPDKTHGNPGFTLDDIHGRFFGIYLHKNPNKDEGANPDVSKLELDGRDGVFVLGMDLKEGKLSIPFQIWDDTLELAQAEVNRAVDWLSTKRDRAGQPIPRPLVFDWDPDKTYMVITEGVITTNVELALFECKITFLIPDGVAFKDKTTGNVDSNDGRTLSKPVITATVTETGEYPVLIESISGQELTILDDTLPVGTVLTIDVEECSIIDQNDNLYLVSLDSQWPVLFEGDFDFRTSTSLIVTTVAFQEGH